MLASTTGSARPLIARPPPASQHGPSVQINLQTYLAALQQVAQHLHLCRLYCRGLARHQCHFRSRQEPITWSLHLPYILESTFAHIFLFLEQFSPQASLNSRESILYSAHYLIRHHSQAWPSLEMAVNRGLVLPPCVVSMTASTVTTSFYPTPAWMTPSISSCKKAVERCSPTLTSTTPIV